MELRGGMEISRLPGLMADAMLGDGMPGADAERRQLCRFQLTRKSLGRMHGVQVGLRLVPASGQDGGGAKLASRVEDVPRLATDAKSLHDHLHKTTKRQAALEMLLKQLI